jgi:hypothetical protein
VRLLLESTLALDGQFGSHLVVGCLHGQDVGVVGWRGGDGRSAKSRLPEF